MAEEQYKSGTARVSSDIPEEPIFAAARKGGREGGCEGGREGGFRGGLVGGLIGSLITLVVCLVLRYGFGL